MAIKIPYSKLPPAWEIDQLRKQEEQRRQEDASRGLHVPSPSNQPPPGYYDDEARRPPSRFPLIESEDHYSF